VDVDALPVCDPNSPFGRPAFLDVALVFPNDDALLRLVTAVLFELDDEWIAFPRSYLPEGSMDQLYPAERPESAPALPNTTNTTTR
ncbi:hypothetical protein ACFCZT_42165, partial [Streptomyces sp. NPDC056230]